VTNSNTKFAEWVEEEIKSNSQHPFSEALFTQTQDRLAKSHYPTRKDEEWKYTPLASLLDSSPQRPEISALDQTLIDELKSAMPDADTLIFVNGIYSETHSDSGTLTHTADKHISLLGDLDEPSRQSVEATIQNSKLTDENIFEQVALGLSRYGLFIHLAKNVECQRPIHLIHISTGSEGTAFTNPIHVFHLEANSRLDVVEQYASQGSGAVVTVPATYVNVENGAKLQHFRIGSENANTKHISNTSVQVAQDGSYQSHQYLLGSELTRSNLEVEFTGKGSTAILRGVYLGDKGQHLDIRTYMDHAHAHCNSDQHFRGIMNGHSRGVFNGLVYVREHAQQTDARQSNKNLLLSRDARVDTKPQLEIFADDVKCTHGATVGELDTNALFYLQSRGIDKQEAALMLTRAFAAEVTQEISLDSLQAYVQEKIAASLDGIVAARV